MSDNAVLSFYDLLDEKQCWINSVSKKPAHMDAYNTVPEYGKLANVIKDVRSTISLEQWQEIYSDCVAHAYLSPNSIILACIIKEYAIKELQQ